MRNSINNLSKSKSNKSITPSSRSKDNSNSLNGYISYSRENLKIDKITPLKKIDSFVLSINIGVDFRLGSVLKNHFYNFYPVNYQGYDFYRRTPFYKVNTGTSKIIIKQFINEPYNYYLSIDISSLDKLCNDLGINISKDNTAFRKDIKTKIIDKLLDRKIPSWRIYLKKCDLALDLKFSFKEDIDSSEFDNFCDSFTKTIINMNFSYLNAEKQNHYNTGYMCSKSGEKKIRFYNKDLKERYDEDGNKIEWVTGYEYVYRIEYIFNDSQIRDNLTSESSNKRALNNIVLRNGFKKLIEKCEGAIKKHKMKVLANYTNDSGRESEGMTKKYTYTNSSDTIFNDNYKMEADTDRIMKGRDPVFEKDSSYYKKRQVLEFSYARFVADKNLKDYFFLFDYIINDRLTKD